MSRTKYSYELKYKAICEVLKGKTISQVAEELNLPCGGSLLRHWLKRYKHPEELLTNKDFDNEEEYQKQLETKENFQFAEIKQLKEKAKSDNIALKKLFEAKKEQRKEVTNQQIIAFKRLMKLKKKQEQELNQQIIVLKSKVGKLTKSKEFLEQNLQAFQKEISELKFKLYQQEGLKIDNLAFKREQKKLLNLIAKLTKDKQKYHDQITTTKMKKEVIVGTRKIILGSGSQHG